MSKGISILVVDDERLLRDLLAKILIREGYQVDTAADGVEALDRLGRNRYHLLVSDIDMPRLNGFELLREVRQNYPEMSVIMMTAFGDSFSVKDSLLLGADEYVTKPFKSFEIHLIVERACWRLLSSKKTASVD